MSNKTLGAARAARLDEFHTRYGDALAGLEPFRDRLAGADILLDTNDGDWSAFWRVLSDRFDEWRIGRVRSVSWDPDWDTLFASDDGGGRVFERTRHGVTERRLACAGSIDDDEVLAMAHEADVVVTNPPFSLFREYVATLMEHDKRFVVIGNQNAIGYKEIFPLLRNNELWLGYGKVKEFIVPSTDHPDRDNVAVGADGTAIAKFGNICWYTNFDIKKRHEDLLLYRRYKGHESDYPKYDNYDAIEVSKVADIPEDYYGMMGVPITFMDKYNPEQFEILGLTCTAETMSAPPQIGEDFIAAYRNAGGTGHLSANMYAVTLFKKGPGKPRIPYGRILIRRKEASNQ